MVSEVRSKFGSRAVTVDNIRFASHAEGHRYQELCLLLAAGEIRELVIQPRYELAPSVVLYGRKRPPLRYTADFSYLERTMPNQWRCVIEDVKGGNATKTEAYVIRRHLLMAIHGIEIREVN